MNRSIETVGAASTESRFCNHSAGLVVGVGGALTGAAFGVATRVDGHGLSSAPPRARFDSKMTCGTPGSVPIFVLGSLF